MAVASDHVAVGVDLPVVVMDVLSLPDQLRRDEKCLPTFLNLDCVWVTTVIDEASITPHVVRIDDHILHREDYGVMVMIASEHTADFYH